MKIAFFVSDLNYKTGWGRYSLGLIKSLVNKGVEVVVFSKIGEDVDMPGVKVYQVFHDPLRVKLNYFSSLSYVFKIRSILKNHRVDIVHCVVEPYSFVCWAVSFLSGFPYIVSVHGSFGIKPYRHFLLGLLQNVFYKGASFIVCVSNYTRERLRVYYSGLNIEVISNGVDQAILDGRNGVEVCAKRNVLMTVGAVKNRKGQHLVVEVMPLLVKDFPDLEYWVVGSQGDKVYLEKLKNFISANDLEGRVKFFQDISDQRLQDLYSKAKVFAMLSQSDDFSFEGFGLVFLEAGFYGVPSITSFDGGGAEAVKDGLTGLVVDCQDKESIVEAFKKMLADSVLYDKLSVNAFNNAKESLWGDKAEDYLSLYKKVYNEKN